MESIWTVRRSASEAKLAGVCAGLARHWGVDPTLVRVGCALLALSGGVGLVLYLAGALLIPAEGRERAVVDDVLGPRARTISRSTWLVIVAAACMVSLVALSKVAPFGMGPAVVLALIWYFGHYKNRPARFAGEPPAPLPAEPVPAAAAAPYAGPPTPFTRAAEAWQRRVAEQTGPQPPVPPPPLADRQRFFATPDPVGLYGPPAPVPITAAGATPLTPAPGARVRHARSRPARRLRLAALVTVAVTLGALAALQSAGVTVPPAVYLGSALAVLSLTLLAAAWAGRARGLLPLSLLVAAATAAATAVPWAEAAVRQHTTTVAYTAPAQLPIEGDRRDLGMLTVDLSRMPVDRDVSYAAALNWGRLEVVTPPGVQVRTVYRLESGSARIFDRHLASGTDFPVEQTVPPARPRPGQPVLTLDLSLTFGEIVVR